MNRSQWIGLAAVAVLSTQIFFAQTLTRAQERAKAKAENVPEIPYESVPNFLKLPPGTVSR